MTYGRFHVKGPRKKVNVKKWIFFYEMWKIIGQIDDFGRSLNIFCNLGVFLAKIKNTQKLLFWKSENKENKVFFSSKIEQLILNVKPSYSMKFMILFICFVIWNVLGHFLLF